jgi:hypothetical protein
MTVKAMAGVEEMVDSVVVVVVGSETVQIRMAMGTEVQVGMEIRVGMEVPMGKGTVEEEATTLQMVTIIAAPTSPKTLPTINQLSSLLLLPLSKSRLPLLPPQQH